MNYQETLDYLYKALPMFQRIGAAAFKKDLGPTIALCNHLGNPETKFKSIHVAGTNGKGSTSHALASVLQDAGYKVGLYTSPHLKSFTERIRVNGKEITQEAVVEFVKNHKDFMEEISPSFFEMTVALAFDYFANENVDIAVVEVGMGGRLDSTNVITPLLSIITNIGLDHVQFLGTTLEEIAGEKAGIIKEGVPVIIGETQKETSPVFTQISRERNASIYFSDQLITVHPETSNIPNLKEYILKNGKGEQITIQLDLLGAYQIKNLPAIYLAFEQLNQLGLFISEENFKRGLSNITQRTGLKGRWQILSKNPLTICDTGHNKDAFKVIVKQLKSIPHNKLFMVLGMVQDKDVEGVLKLLPIEAAYAFCQSQIPRAMPAADLASLAASLGLDGIVMLDVNDAINYFQKKAGPDDLIFVGGSTFVVAEIKEL
ncbi:bifunctional folylpolyglutamate synthase/dihydrofolate synthase [Lunatibacter salilacus]|uniref:bifunctional folylpolyglutamate synthase/dihydrofolate synthase n=1 Tax=Lunatibacter salilacus TaxID=2483804 RepID=UPI00131DBEBD|nr:folylpolyglutamate synthase/dihydrofolate synthase family protein [Lunatibacter salilacus]